MAIICIDDKPVLILNQTSNWLSLRSISIWGVPHARWTDFGPSVWNFEVARISIPSHRMILQFVAFCSPNFDESIYTRPVIQFHLQMVFIELKGLSCPCHETNMRNSVPEVCLAHGFGNNQTAIIAMRLGHIEWMRDNTGVVQSNSNKEIIHHELNS